MATVKNHSKAILKEPESAGAKVERKNPPDKNSIQPPVAPKTAGANEKASPSSDPFSNRRSDAPSVSGKTTRPSDRPGEEAMPPNPETTDDSAVDAPTRTPNVRDPDLLPDEVAFT